jgi:quinol monooxygenase YgiN
MGTSTVVVRFPCGCSRCGGHAGSRGRAQTPAPTPARRGTAGVAVRGHYIEVEPARRCRAPPRWRATGRRSGRPLAFAVFEQIGRPNHFAIVEQWPSAKAREDNAASAASRDFRAASRRPPDRAPDERPHFALSTGTRAATPTAVYVVTHADIVPPKREEGTAEVRKLAEASRGTAGNVGFDALVQASRLNHLTLVEAWTDAAAREAHSAATPTRSFRTAFGPMSGALYDERLYTLLK